MATKKLARELGLIQKYRKSERRQTTCPNQEYEYLLVLDFESTCWENDKTIPPEVIEFPVVLLDLKSGNILDEFQQFVFPTEHATLSDFCTKFTGITQGQIEKNGVPLSTAIGLFIKWLSNLSLKYGFSVVPSKSRNKLATFTTWSDWDLGRCLKFECNRKSINKPSYFNYWIDLRALYKKFYKRKPEGLSAAMQDVGLKFEGREHSGLTDARNTARLSVKMAQDGCLFEISKS
ncbi:UNVERIFIED_CONTAM: hypothetical protein RMT77_013529 [Armadillidium vulgare]